MARRPASNDFNVPVEGVGDFTFAKRKFDDERKIQVEYARFVDGVEPTTWLHLLGEWTSTLKVLTVRAPEGWDVDEMDPLDNETYSQLRRVFEALRAKEESFRRKPAQDGKTSGAGAVENDGVLVSPQVQPND